MFHSYYSAFRVFVRALDLPWNRYQRENLLQLGAAFIQCRSLPLRRMARTMAGPGKSHRAPDKRLRRFLGNGQLDMDALLSCLLQFLVRRLGHVPFVPVMVDWTFCFDRAILWVQIPYRGRSLPLVASIHPRQLGADDERMGQAEQALLTRIRTAWPQNAPPPLVLADRGFARTPLLKWLRQEGWLFLIRARQGTYVYAGQQLTARELWDDLQPAPGEIRVFANAYYQKTERVPVTLVATAAWNPRKGTRALWWLATNLPEQFLQQAPRLYAQRMQPEETHRDSKRGHFVSGFALSHLWRMRPDRLAKLVCLLSVIYCFLVLVAETDPETREWLSRKHWGLSLGTFGLDLLVQAGTAAVSLARRACASVTLKPLWLQGGDS